MKGGIPRNSCLAQWRNKKETSILIQSSHFPIGLYSKVDVAYKKDGVLDYSFITWYCAMHVHTYSLIYACLLKWVVRLCLICLCICLCIGERCAYK